MVETLLFLFTQLHHKPEGGAHPLFTLHTDSPLHHLRKVFADRETQAGSSVLAGGRAIHLAKHLKEMVRLLLGDPDSRIGNGEAYPYIFGKLFLQRYPDHHLPRVGKFYRIVEEVNDDLPEPDRIPLQQVGNAILYVHHRLKPLFMSLQGDHIHRILHGIEEIKVDALQSQLTRFDFGEVQNVIYEAEQHIGGKLYLSGVLLLLRVKGGIGQKLGHTYDGVDRGSNLVAHIGQEFTLGAGRPFRGLLGLLQFLFITLSYTDILNKEDEAAQIRASLYFRAEVGDVEAPPRDVTISPVILHLPGS